MTTMAYDTTGQIASIKDPAVNKTTLSYGDSFYTDNPFQSFSPPAGLLNP